MHRTPDRRAPRRSRRRTTALLPSLLATTMLVACSDGVDHEMSARALDSTDLVTSGGGVAVGQDPVVHAPTSTTPSSPATTPKGTGLVSSDGLEHVAPEPTNGGIDPTFAYRLTDPSRDMVVLVPDGGSFLLGASEGGVPDRVYELDSGSIIDTYDTRTASVFAPKIFDSTGSRYFDGSALWNTATGEQVGNISFPHWGAGFSTNGSKLALLGLENRPEQPNRAFLVIELIEAGDGSAIWTSHLDGPAGDLQGPLSRLRFSDDDSEIYLGDQILDAATGELRSGNAPPLTGPGFWDPAILQTLGLSVDECSPMVTQGPVTSGCAISRDGTRIAVVGNGVLRIWEIKP